MFAAQTLASHSSRPRGGASPGWAGVLVLLGAACGGPASTDEGPRNLLLIVLDTTRADHLGCFGAERDTSPTVDSLAARGTRCASAYAQSSLTPVSAASFLTGAWPFRTGIRSLFVVSEDTLSGEVTSLFEHLRGAGRRTAGFVSARPMGAHYGLDRGFDEYHDEIAATQAPGTVRRAVQRPAERTTQLLLDWLAENGDEPFGCLLHYFDAHDVAFVPPVAFLEQHVSFPLPQDLGREPTVEQVRALFRTPEQRRELYDAEIRYMDGQIARVLAELEALGVLDETLVCVVADHGESLGEHEFWDHGLLWEEQLRVPWVLAGPGLPGGVVLEARVRLVDLAPTLAELFGVTASTDGESILPLIRGATEAGSRAVYAEVRHAPGDRLGRPASLHALMLGDLKYIVSGADGRAPQLFDVGVDPREAHDLLAEPAPDRTRRHRAVLEAWNALGAGGASLEGVDPEVIEELRELGYL